MCLNTFLRSLWIISWSLLFILTEIRSQDLKVASPKSEDTSERLDELFSSFSYVELSNRKFFQRGTDENITFQISEKEEIQLILTRAPILSDNYSIKTSSQNQENISVSELAIPYSGYVAGDPSSTVRLTMDEGFIYGYINYRKNQWYIEPASKLDARLKSDLHILYNENGVIQREEITCAAEVLKKELPKTSGQLKSATCQNVELAIAMDYGYRQSHGGSQGAINQSIAVMNMVAGSYEDSFSDDIRFEIVTHYVSNCSSCNPWTSSTDANTLLNSFTNWAPGGFGVTHDVGQLWTSRNICSPEGCSVAGLAWIDAVCGTWRYHILEDFTSEAWQLRVLVAHEMGHNFGALHDGSTSPHIMRPSIAVNTTSWSSQSISQVNAALDDFDCFDDCVTGSCTEILSAAPSNCSPGNPGTYDLTLEIRHGGGGTSSSFDVLVNGTSHNFNWASSPQTIVIEGLDADGSLSNLVSIEADDGSDTNCGGVAEYDEPTAGCTLSINEDFNNCTIPDGWTSSSTNIYTWNGGDPLVQYEWKFDDETRAFANYDDGSNASSLKTIDGTCMALMDDDIIFHELYTGSVTLTSATYDMRDFDIVNLKFDYNFHPFEDGGGNKGINNSYFEVQVYNGTSWVTVLSDSDSSCPWSNVWPSSCATGADIDASPYKNEFFRVRFIYSDGNSGSWTGMVALDNISMSGSVTPAEPTCSDGMMNGDETGVDCGGTCPSCETDCPGVLVLTQADATGEFEARDMIMTQGSISLGGPTSWSADQVEINDPFEVVFGTIFEANNDGCDP